MTAERPLIFTAESVRSILAGTKTQTRRLMKPQPAHVQHHEWRGKLVYEGERRLWCWNGHTYDNLIGEDDARAEGVEPRITLGKVYPSKHAADVEHRSYRDGYAAAWGQINGKRAAWASNPWVWAVSFRRVS